MNKQQMRQVYAMLSPSWQRAIKRAFDEHIEAVEMKSGRWAVPSVSKPGHLHFIDPQPNGAPMCDCEAGQRGMPCKHAARVMTVLWMQTEIETPKSAARIERIEPAPVSTTLKRNQIYRESAA